MLLGTFLLCSLLTVSNILAQNLRRYKVCNGSRCQSVRSFISPEYLFDLDGFTYTGWSRWSPCTRRCSTQRYRACRFPSICGERMMIYEEAFCYRRGSHCEQIFHAHHSQQPEEEDDMDYSSASSTWDSSSSNEQRSSEYISQRGYADRLSMSMPEDGTNDSMRPSGRRKSVPSSSAILSTTPLPRLRNSTQPSRRREIQRNKSKRHHKNSDSHNEEDVEQCGVARLSERMLWTGPSLRILGGQEARKGRWPWQVAILNRMQEAFCGGTLIAPRWILTAAHCVRRRIHVTIGEHHLHRNEGTEKHYRIDAAFIHPDFDPDTVNNDIALLLLPEPVSTQTGVACLPEQEQSLPAPDTLCTILGWGKERHNHVFGTTVLHEGKVPIVNTAECRFTYPYEITNNMFCAGYKGGTVDSCAGDSGGPILCSVNSRWTVFGVTSFGDGCGRMGKYGIYAKVPNYVEWIYKVIQANQWSP